jgi:hypothetical protein
LKVNLRYKSESAHAGLFRRKSQALESSSERKRDANGTRGRPRIVTGSEKCPGAISDLARRGRRYEKKQRQPLLIMQKRSEKSENEGQTRDTLSSFLLSYLTSHFSLPCPCWVTCLPPDRG